MRRETSVLRYQRKTSTEVHHCRERHPAIQVTIRSCGVETFHILKIFFCLTLKFAVSFLQQAGPHFSSVDGVDEHGCIVLHGNQIINDNLGIKRFKSELKNISMTD